jgi:transcriptional regulator with XRE-family HTH domain
LEEQIIDRLKSARRFRGKTQSGLAAEIGVTRSHFLSVEQKLSRLRALTAWTACKKLDISPEWLYSGLGKMEGFQSESYTSHVDWWAFDFFKKLRSVSFADAWPLASPIINPKGESSTGARDDMTRKWANETAQALNAKNLSLKGSSECCNTDDVQSELCQLLEQVRSLTKPKGMKAKLARDLGIPKPRVSEWLAGKYQPSGEAALKIQKWVAHHEKQNQT